MIRTVSACLALAVVASASSVVKVDRIAYHGWPGCYRMSNGTVELVVVPQIGRIMRFAKIGGANILWENPKLEGKTSITAKPGEWANYGGDKLWPAPQSKWGWPPDPILDGTPVEVSVVGRFLAITGVNSPKSGVRFVRCISMDPAGSTVRIENRMTNTASSPQELALWEITQTDNPDRVIVPLQVTPEMPLGWAPYDAKPIDSAFAAVRGGVLVVHRNPKTGFKLGSASAKGYLAAERGVDRFTTSVRKLAGRYVDEGKFLEVYGNADPDDYMELEMTGPLTKLRPGQTAKLEATWGISRVRVTN